MLVESPDKFYAVYHKLNLSILTIKSLVVKRFDYSVINKMNTPVHLDAATIILRPT